VILLLMCEAVVVWNFYCEIRRLLMMNVAGFLCVSVVKGLVWFWLLLFL